MVCVVEVKDASVLKAPVGDGWECSCLVAVNELFAGNCCHKDKIVFLLHCSCAGCTCASTPACVRSCSSVVRSGRPLLDVLAVDRMHFWTCLMWPSSVAVLTQCACAWLWHLPLVTLGGTLYQRLRMVKAWSDIPCFFGVEAPRAMSIWFFI